MSARTNYLVVASLVYVVTKIGCTRIQHVVSHNHCALADEALLLQPLQVGQIAVLLVVDEDERVRGVAVL
jgi:hypothetical protein